MTIATWLAPAALVAVTAVVGCSGTSIEEVTGVVVDVTGDITTVDRFVVQTGDGERLEFQVAPGVTFANGAPIGHLTEHVQTGEPVEIRYEVLDDGSRVVRAIADG
ncbi:MAG: hypothetical protein M3349_04845 [Actinomycetota bacterium]|nr:hypothetical protein [Actinomycetota bacterium]